jgi:tetratricopeptide (TPR) repeat protein
VSEEFVVCPSCATRIKAGREFCLRCFGPLPTAGRPLRLPIWISFGLSEQKQLMVVIGVAALIVGLIAVIVITEPPSVDETPVPVARTVTPRAAAPARSADAPVATDPSAAAPAAAASQSSETTVADPRLDQLRATYEEKLAKSPNDAVTLNNLGLLLGEMGEPEEAFKRLEAAIAASPRKAEYRMNLANVARDLGQFDRAVNEYREITRLAPKDYGAKYALAMALQKKGDDQSAVAELEKARHLGPDNPAVPIAMAESLERLGRTNDAVREYQEYLKLQPNSGDAGRVRSRLTALSGGGPQVQ